MARFSRWSFRALSPKVSPGVSVLTIGVGFLVLVGWILDVEVLKRLLPSLVSMNPLTAVAFILCGASLGLTSQQKGGAHTGAQVLALLVMGIGLFRLLGYAFDWEWGLDQWLFERKLVDDIGTYTNRMAPNTALNFIFVGCGLLLVDKTTRRGKRPTDIFALLVGFISLLALLGYLYNASWLYGFDSFIPMALHTALVFHLLSLGLLCTRSKGGLMALILSDGPGGGLIRRLFPIVIPSLVLLGWLRLAGEHHGWFEAEMGTTLYTIIGILMVTGLIWGTARSMQHAEKERRRLEDDLERFFTVSLDMLCIAGMDGYFKRINPEFCRTLGYTMDELLERPFIEFVHPDDRADTLLETGSVGVGTPSDHFENRYLCKDGTVRWFWWKGQNLEEEGLIYATARDITEQKTFQEEIKKLNQTLQERATQMDAANQELEAFSYSVSHDLRAPLRGISGFAQALEEHAKESLDATSQGYLMRVRRAAERMGYLIDDLLKLSRLTRAEMFLEQVNLSAQAESILKHIQQRDPQRSVEWHVEPDLMVFGDASLIQILMENLLENAWKFTSKNPAARIEVGMTRMEEGDHVCYVRDNGVGFDMRYASKLFGAFQRLHSMVEFPGTGIGLATVQRVVRRHGGRVWAKSQINEGSTFYFVI